MLQRLWCLLRELNKQNKEVRRRSLAETVQKPLKFYLRVQEIHQPDRQKQHSNLGQSNSLSIMCILPFQRGQFVHFGLVESRNQLCASRTLINLFVIFYTRHQMIEAARRDKNGVLQCAIVSWLSR